MTGHVHLDAVGGIAGDMFVAACLHAWPDLGDELEPVVRAAGLPDDWAVESTPGTSHSLAGLRVRFTPPATGAVRPSGDHAAIRERLQASTLPAAVIERAVDIFHHLAVAEATCHGIDVDDVHFHEIADWDSVADIAAAAWLIETVDAPTWTVSPPPLGSGTVQTAHGRLPIPAPATSLLLAGLQVVDDGIPGERVTPTGAAILRHLGATTSSPPPGLISATGHGLGTRELPDRPNMVRLLALDTTTGGSPTPWDVGAVSVITFEVDDQTPEDLAVGLDSVRAHDGVIDVLQSAVTGKKNRMAAHVQVLCRTDARDRVIAACFEQTTTIGLRWRDEDRAELRRHQVRRGDVAGKAVARPDGSMTAKPEIDDLARVGSTQADRATARRAFDSDGRR